MEKLQIIKNWLLLNNINIYFIKNKISTITIVLILFYYNGFSQNNLVPNSSFESYSSCPANDELYKAIPWYQPNLTGSSSDYYHTCSGHVPNYVTYQYPHTGNGFAGINLFHDTTSPWKDWDREYIEVRLIDSLIKAKKYCVRFYANQANRNWYAIKNIQAVLTDTSLLYNDLNYGYITGVTPIMEADSIITDTLHWIPIKTIYIAGGGENYLTIGNFSSGNNTVYKYVGGAGTLGYYLIDDVSIYEQPEIYAGADTLLPQGDSVQLGSTGRADVFYNWLPVTGLNNPHIANPIAKPTTCITYTLTVTDTNQLACTSIFTDEVTINIQNCDTTKTLIIPNVFTPNNDNINDEWVLKNLPSETHIKIYNRWGIVVVGEDAISVQGSYKWDGRTTAGLESNDGVYYYIITSEEKTYRGFLQLIR